MGPSLLLLLLLLGLEGLGSAGSLPEVLRVHVGSSILVQCHYRLQDLRARKVWCRLSPEGCRPLVSSAVDRAALGDRRVFLTDLGGGLLQVEMLALQEEDAGQYGCVVEGAMGPQTVHMVSLEVLPPGRVGRPHSRSPRLLRMRAGDLLWGGKGGGRGLPSTVSTSSEQPVPGPRKEGREETHKTGDLAEDPSLDPAGSASPWELGQQERSIPLIWGAVLLLGLLVAAVVLFAVLARRKGNRRGVGGQFQSSRVSGMGPSSADPVSESGLVAGLPLDAPYVKLDSPPSFDSTTYANCPLGPPSGKPPPPPPPSLPPLPPKIIMSSKPVTYATVIFPGGAKGGGASCEPAQDPPNSQTPPS